MEKLASDRQVRLKVGFFGGSFNPVHNGHIALARSLLAALGLDEVWFVVSPQNPFKVNERLLDDASRMEMVRAALAGEARLRPCDVEFGLPRPSYTWNTLCHLSRTCPQCEFTLLIGGDNWASFPRWYRGGDILANYRVAVYPRRGSCPQTVKEALPRGVVMVETPLIDISSTGIRRRVSEGLSVEGLVPEAVAEMIRRNGWYAEK